jgi:two-component system, cell cycle sensor histidine kinase and response regulator CckA
MSAFATNTTSATAECVPIGVWPIDEGSLLSRAALGLAHDLNNFLTGTLLYCDLLRERLCVDHELAGHVESICFTSAQASGLATQLLSLGRSRSFGAEACDLSRSIEGMMDLLARLVGKQVELKCEIEPGLGRVAVDAVKLQRVLLNLVLNARNAMPEGGCIRIRALCPRPSEEVSQNSSATESSPALPFVLLEVSDTGHGMDAATRARVLDPFFTTKPLETGYGMGLPAVQDVVKGCGGEFELGSNLGCGTTIRMLLPSSRDPAGA